MTPDQRAETLAMAGIPLRLNSARVQQLIDSAEAMAANSRAEYGIRAGMDTATALRELLALRLAERRGAA